MKRIIILAAILMIQFSTASAQKITHEELTEILGIKSWRMPMPKDEKMEWSFEIVAYAKRNFANINNTQFDSGQKALIVFREMENDKYHFSLKQRKGLSEGNIEINICSEKERKENQCDNSYSLEWFDDGTKFVIAEISSMIESDKPKKQVILKLTKFKL